MWKHLIGITSVAVTKKNEREYLTPWAPCRRGSVNRWHGAVWKSHKISRLRRAWSSAIAISIPNNKGLLSPLLNISSCPLNLLRASATTKCCHSSPAFPCVFIVRSFEVWGFFWVFLHGASSGRVWRSVKKLVRRWFHFLVLSFHRCSVAASLRREEEANNRVLRVWVQAKRLATLLSCCWRRSCTSELGFAMLRTLIWAQNLTSAVVAFLASSRNRVSCQ